MARTTIWCRVAHCASPHTVICNVPVFRCDTRYLGMPTARRTEAHRRQNTSEHTAERVSRALVHPGGARIDAAASDLGFVVDGFEVVAVRTDDERCIVAPAVLRAQTRRAVVLATRLERRAIESVDLLATLGLERQVKMRRLLVGLEQAQRDVTPRRHELDAVRRGPFPDDNNPERFERLEKE